MFLKSNSPRFPAERGVKSKENSLEMGLKSFPTDQHGFHFRIARGHCVEAMYHWEDFAAVLIHVYS